MVIQTVLNGCWAFVQRVAVVNKWLLGPFVTSLSCVYDVAKAISYVANVN
jgi:hypothetical protein